MDNKNFGQVKISNDVIATIAGIAATEVEGVLSSSKITDKILRNNGITVQIEEEISKVFVEIGVVFGYSIPEVCFKVQENIIYTLETMTGLKIKEVDVKVTGIGFKKEKNDKEEVKSSN